MFQQLEMELHVLEVFGAYIWSDSSCGGNSTSEFWASNCSQTVGEDIPGTGLPAIGASHCLTASENEEANEGQCFRHWNGTMGHRAHSSS